LDKAIETLKKNFDYVILDTAPVGMVTDFTNIETNYHYFLPQQRKTDSKITRDKGFTFTTDCGSNKIHLLVISKHKLKITFGHCGRFHSSGFVLILKYSNSTLLFIS